MFADEYENTIKNTFKGNPILTLWMTNGLKNKGFELRMSGCGYSFDIFLHYKLNKKKQCTYFHGNNKIIS